MWSRRAQGYEQKINSGKIYELAEVVKDLNKTSNTIADQSYSERQLFEKAYDRLQSEFEVVLQISQVDVKKKMDKALGRNQNLEEEEIKI
jgi:CarD family transcriptional regulator